MALTAAPESVARNAAGSVLVSVIAAEPHIRGKAIEEHFKGNISVAGRAGQKMSMKVHATGGRG